MYTKEVQCTVFIVFKIYLFFKTKTNPITVKHSELRNNYGDLINVKEKIQECYKYLGLN